METNPAKRGFSLLEVLIAATITALLVVLLSQVLISFTSLWTAGNSNTERRQSGRAVMDYIGRELRAAVLPLDPVAGATPANLQFVLNPPQVTTSCRNPSALFWQAPTAKNSAGGDLAEFGYFVRWIPGDPPRAALCRFYADSDDTTGYLIYSKADWIDSALLDASAPADSASGYRGLFTQNVAGFWARCLDADGSELAPADGQFDSRSTHTLPSSVEISILLLDSRTADRLTISMQTQLRELVNESVSADDCEVRIQAASGLHLLAAGCRAYATRVFLENAR